MPLARAQMSEGAILYDPRRIELPTAADFDPAALQAGNRIERVATGRGRVWFVTARHPHDGDRTWVLRHYRRGGLAARLSEDRYAWLGESRTRGFRELRLLEHLRLRGLSVPAPVAACYRREGATYRADLLTVAIPGAQTLAALRRSLGASPMPRAVALDIGACVRRLHDAGVWHADLNAHNVLIDDDRRVWIIDFDRAEERAPGAWTKANLARLRRSLDKVSAGNAMPLPEDDWNALLAGYEGV